MGNIKEADVHAYNKMISIQRVLQKMPLDDKLCQQEQQARNEYYEIHKSYLSFLYQKEKASLLKEGDDNTTYFHASIRARRISNRIFSIKNMDGTWVNESNKVSDAFLQ